MLFCCIWHVFAVHCVFGEVLGLGQLSGHVINIVCSAVCRACAPATVYTEQRQWAATAIEQLNPANHLCCSYLHASNMHMTTVLVLHHTPLQCKDVHCVQAFVQAHQHVQWLCVALTMKPLWEFSSC